MLQYPKEYNLLNEEELEYTGGGSDADFMLALAAGGLAGVIVSSVVYILNGENIRNRKKSRKSGKVSAGYGCRKAQAAGGRHQGRTYDLSAGGDLAGGVCGIGCVHCSGCRYQHSKHVRWPEETVREELI